MVNIPLAVGRRTVDLEIDASHLLDILTPALPAERHSPAALVETKLKAAAFDEIVRQKRSATIVVPDKTRRCGARHFLPVLLERLNAAGIAEQKVRVVLANGSHPGHRRQEIEDILGREVARRVLVTQHDCRDSTHLRFLGTTQFDTPVWLSDYVLDTECLLVTGTVVHHYFAGYGGGAKMINPGCAGEETIKRNHALTIDRERGGIHPGCGPGQMAGNPVQEDIWSSMRFVRSDFLLETLLDEHGRIVEVVCGRDLRETHLAACRLADRFYRRPIAKRADLVVVSCGGWPKDINLIQSHKAIRHAFQAVKPGGVILAVAECSQGIGSETFLPWFDIEDDSTLAAELAENYTLNGTTALSVRTMARSATIVLVSELEESVVRKIGLLPARTLQEGWRTAGSLLPEKFDCYVLPNGSLTLPEVR